MKILIAISNQSNRDLLLQYLSKEYEIMDFLGVFPSEFDLCIIDSPTLSKNWDMIKSIKKKSEPVFLPILVLSLRKDVGLSTKRLWEFVDDILNLPISKDELLSRIRNLLLARTLSIELIQRDQELLQFSRAETAEARQLATAMFSDHDAVMLLIDPRTYQIVDANPSALRFYGYSKEEMLGLKISDINITEKDETQKNISKASLRRQNFFTMPHQLKDGSLKVVDVFSCPISYYDKTMLFSIIFDVTEREQLRNDLMLEKEYLSNLIQNANAPIITWTKDYKIKEFNNAFESLSGLNRDQVVGKKIDLLFPDSEKANLMNRIIESTNTQWTNVEIPIKHVSGSVHIVLWNSAPLLDNLGAYFATIAQGTDITKRIEAETKEKYLNDHDYLTGLYSRRYFETRIREFDEAGMLPFTVLFIDLNGLNHVNVSFGYPVGDDMIKMAAHKLNGIFSDVNIVARIGGDEFAVFIPESDKATLERIVRTLRTNNELIHEKTRVTLSFAFGYGTKSSSSQTLDSVLNEADKHLFRNKIYESTSARHDIVNVIMSALFEKSKRENAHSVRVSTISALIATEMGMSREEVNRLRITGLVHDIGKIGISEKVLNKPGSLNDDEWNEMRGHSQSGWRILNSILNFQELADFVLHHHERWDGKGYPDGLKHEAIPFESRIISVADAFDAMTSSRTYRSAMSYKDAGLEILKHAESQFDPEIAKLFVEKLLPNLK